MKVQMTKSDLEITQKILMHANASSCNFMQLDYVTVSNADATRLLMFSRASG